MEEKIQQRLKEAITDGVFTAGIVGVVDAHAAGSLGPEAARQTPSLCVARPSHERHGQA